MQCGQKLGRSASEAKNAEELGAGLCAISEPRQVPESSQWFASGNGLATIFWRPLTALERCKLLFKKQDIVVVEWAGI